MQSVINESILFHVRTIYKPMAIDLHAWWLQGQVLDAPKESGLFKSGRNKVTTVIVRHDSKQLAKGGRAVCGEQTSWPVDDLHCRFIKQAFGDTTRRVVASMRFDQVALVRGRAAHS